MWDANNRRSEHFCSNAVLCAGFTWQIVKTRVIRLRGVEGRNMRDQIAFCTFHSFLVEVQANCWQHTCDACVITTWRLGLRAPLVARNYSIIENITVNSLGLLTGTMPFSIDVRLIESQLKGVINLGTSSRWPSCICQLPGRVWFSNRVAMSAC